VAKQSPFGTLAFSAALQMHCSHKGLCFAAGSQVLDRERFVGMTLTRRQEEELDRLIASEGKTQAQVLRELLDRAMGIESAILPAETASQQQPGRKKRR
jgi:hypothetical protein